MSSSNSPATHDSKPQSELDIVPNRPVSEAGAQGSSDPPPPLEKSPENSEISEDGSVAGGEAKEAREEEEEECGFCIFMKGGGCATEFIAWEKCVDAGDRNNEDIVEKCFELTFALKKCMEAHSDYYGPLLDAEKAAHEMANKEFEEEQEKQGVEGVEEFATTAEDSDKGGVLRVSEQGSETKDSVLSPTEQEKN